MGVRNTEQIAPPTRTTQLVQLSSQKASFWESARLALSSVRGSKLRSFLTLAKVRLPEPA